MYFEAVISVSVTHRKQTWIETRESDTDLHVGFYMEHIKEEQLALLKSAGPYGSS